MAKKKIEVDEAPRAARFAHPDDPNLTHGTAYSSEDYPGLGIRVPVPSLESEGRMDKRVRYSHTNGKNVKES